MSLFVRSAVCILVLLPFVFSLKDERNYPKMRSFNGNLKLTDNNTDYLLPTNLKPSFYDLRIQPYLDNNTFSGSVTIMFDVISATDSVVLNMDNNYITLISYSLETSQSVEITNTTMDPVHTKIMFNLNDTLEEETNLNLTIAYSGILAADMLGFYVSTYNTSTQHSMAITQFESTYARRAFPCFDEPKYRAVFNVSILRLSSQNSMANMPLDSSDTMPSGWVLDTYDSTPAMPTYLVAFGVSDLSNITNGTFRLFVRKAALNQAAYLNTVGQDLLDTIGSFVDIPYPLPKMDVVAVPDFNAGAMENWGLCTYREKYMLYNSTLNTWRDKYGVLSVNAHEFGHQWTGDLVTPELWDYAWLNEAFATYFEYVIPNMVEAGWNVGSTEFVLSAVQVALHSDTGNPRAMTSPVYSPEQIEDSFDYVIYEKGGSVLRMAENFLTTDVWKKGLNMYLKTNAYKTGTPEALFSALQGAATDLDNVNETMQGWTRQPGYPLITVTNNDNSVNNKTSTTYTITQTPYGFDDNTTSYKWNVPLRYTTEFDREFNASQASLMWLLSNMSSATVTVNTSGWVIFNVDRIGFYRVNYDEGNWIKLKAELDNNLTAISAINRAQLLDDAMHLAYSGHLNYSTALELAEFLVNETASEPWSVFFSNVRELVNQFYGTSTANGLQTWAQNLMVHAWDALTKDLDKTTSTYHGSLTLLLASQFACDIGLSSCESLAKISFEKWQQDQSFITVPEMKQAIICTGLRLDKTGNSFTNVWNYFLSSNNGLEQLMLIKAMGCLSNEATIKLYLDAVCNSSANYVRLQDRWVAFQALLTRQTGVLTGLQYIIDNYANVNSSLGSDFSNVFDYLGETISQEDHIDVVKNAINNNAYDKALRDALNTTVLPEIMKRATWAQSSQAQALMTWVKEETKSSATYSTVNVALTITALFLIKLTWY